MTRSISITCNALSKQTPNFSDSTGHIMRTDPLGVPASLITDSGTAFYMGLAKLAAKTGADVARLPHTLKILLENIARGLQW